VNEISAPFPLLWEDDTLACYFAPVRNLQARNDERKRGECTVRLTLRTLLAYLDDTLDAAEIKQIGQKVAESETARELIARIKSVTRRRRLTTPPLTGSGEKFDPNTIAEYLDNTLSAEQVAEVEKLCLESDVHLAEIATCHQILTLVLGEPALVPPSAKRRMYALVDKGRTSGIRRAVPPASAASSRSLEDSAEDDTLLLGLPPMDRGTWLRWLLPIAGCLLLAGLVYAIVMALPKGDDYAQRLRNRRTQDSGAPIAPKEAGQKGTTNGGKDNKDKDQNTADKDAKDKDAGKDAKDKDGVNKDKPGDGDTSTPPVKPSGIATLSTKAPVWSGAPPSTKRQLIGKFVRNNAYQDLLMQSQGDTGQWRRLVSGARVGSNDSLVSLPGYRSELVMDNGLHMVLWGNVGQQLSLPILESAVILHAAEPDKEGGMADLDFTLSRGRVWILNQKKGDQPAFVRLRFHKEIWDLTLQPNTEVGMELVGRELGLKPVRAEEEPGASLYLVVKKGRAVIRDDLREFPPMTGPAILGWSNTAGTWPAGPQALNPWPAEWEQPVQMRQGVPAGPEMERALNSLQKRLAEDGPVGNLLASTLDAPEPAGRFLTVLCFGAIDAIEDLADCLGNERAEVRDAATEALRHWLGRDASQRERFRSLLDRKRFTKTEVDTVLHLLRIPGPEDYADHDTYSIPIDELGSDKVAIRHLAFWHLQRLANKEMKENQLLFDPVGPQERRDLVQRKWKKLLDDDKLPPKEFRQGGKGN
jgi:hypothetical protein